MRFSSVLEIVSLEKLHYILKYKIKIIYIYISKLFYINDIRKIIYIKLPTSYLHITSTSEVSHT
jgi:hypothetical protein